MIRSGGLQAAISPGHWQVGDKADAPWCPYGVTEECALTRDGRHEWRPYGRRSATTVVAAAFLRHTTSYDNRVVDTVGIMDRLFDRSKFVGSLYVNTV